VVSGTFKGHEQKAFATAITFTCLNTGKLERDVSVPVRRTKLFPANVALRAEHMRVSPFAVLPVTCENYQSAGVTARFNFQSTLHNKPKDHQWSSSLRLGCLCGRLGPHEMQYRE